jgi:hypothetical protein
MIGAGAVLVEVGNTSYVESQCYYGKMYHVIKFAYFEKLTGFIIDSYTKMCY